MAARRSHGRRGLSRSGDGSAAGTPPWRCPTCRLPLSEDGAGAWCDAGHRIDRAREGYLHLLPGGRLRGRAPGDTADMLAARRALFDAGHYRPVQDAVAAAVASAGPQVALDAGCGEGTYLAAIDAPVRLGIDVAKPGVRMAARRWPGCRFAIASSFQLPLDDGSIDALVSVFAPRAFAEFARVLRPGGVAVLASPGPDHLAGVTALIYGESRPHEQRPHTAEDPEVPTAPVQRVRVRYELALRTAADVEHLVRMTPYWWKATPAQRADLTRRDRLDTTVDVLVTVHDLGRPPG